MNKPIVPKWILFLSQFHAKFVYAHRTRALAGLIAKMVPDDCRLLDLGCGDGKISAMIMKESPKLIVHGLDIKRRPQTEIPINIFDGRNLPLKEASVDSVLIIDVLHHTRNPKSLLQEAVRVSKRYIIIKDHFLNRIWDRFILQFMDWVGNRSQGVALPYNYWGEKRWREIWAELGLKIEILQKNLKLYPWPADLIFGGNLHFLVKLSNK